MVRCSLVLVATALLTSAGELRAAPELTVSADGDCPNSSELETAMAARGLKLGGSDYVVVTQAEPAGVRVRLLRESGQQIFERHIASQDCRAVADAVAVVIEAYFAEVIALPEKGQANASEPIAANDKVLHSETAVRVRSPTTSDTLLRPPGAAALPAAQPSKLPAGLPLLRAAPVPQPEQNANSVYASRAPWLVGGFVGFGPVMALPVNSFQPQVELGGGADFPTVPVSTEVALMTTWPATSGGEPNRVQRWASQGLLRVGVPASHKLRYRPWGGLGIARSQLRAMDIAEAPTKTTTAALVGLGLELAWPISKGWLGRADTSCLVLTTRDMYLIAPDGVIGRGPRVVCSVMLGIGLGGTPAN